jgi:hypothetical protein
LGTGLSGGPITTSGTISLDKDLEAIAALSGTSGFLKKTAANTWTLDTNTYLTQHQSLANYVTKATQNNQLKAYLVGVDSSASGSKTALLYDSGIYATATSGQLNATAFKVNEKVTLEYLTDYEALAIKFV